MASRAAHSIRDGDDYLIMKVCMLENNKSSANENILNLAAWQEEAVSHDRMIGEARAGAVLPRGKGRGAAPEVGGGEAAISGRLSSPLLLIWAVSYSELTEILASSIWKDKQCGKSREKKVNGH